MNKFLLAATARQAGICSNWHPQFVQVWLIQSGHLSGRDVPIPTPRNFRKAAIGLLRAPARYAGCLQDIGAGMDIEIAVPEQLPRGLGPV